MIIGVKSKNSWNQKNLVDLYPKMLHSANANAVLQDTCVFHDLGRNGSESLEEGTMSNEGK